MLALKVMCSVFCRFWTLNNKNISALISLEGAGLCFDDDDDDANDDCGGGYSYDFQNDDDDDDGDDDSIQIQKRREELSHLICPQMYT